ncbi:MAG: hypothetical protein AAF442_05435 [Pseudomonadota bacterium]
MFKIDPDYTCKRLVKVRVPIDGGQFRDEVFTAHFKIIGIAESESHIEKDPQGESLLREVLVGWDNVCDKDGNALPFEGAAIDNVLNHPSARRALVQAYTEAVTADRVKN